MLTKEFVIDTNDNLCLNDVNVSPYNLVRERDWEALNLLFDRDDSDEIEADIQSKLLFLVPEPCWEDNPFDFLQEFL